MPFQHRFFAALFFGFVLSLSANAQPGGNRDELEAMFANIAKKTKWAMSKDMCWGYFFTNQSRAKLDVAARDLARKGYRIVEVYLSDKQDSDSPALWWLHVERIETHSVESLLMRNIELNAFAKTHHLDSYDGMDVGPAGGTDKMACLLN